MPPQQALSTSELEELPRGAIVAFAARSARRVQPIFEQDWPNAPQGHKDALEKAIAFAENVACDPAQPANPAADREATRAARAAHEAGREAGRAGRGAAHNAAQAAAEAAKAAQAACIGSDARAAAHAAHAAEAAARSARGVGMGANAAGDAAYHQFVTALRQDYEKLRAAATEWTDETPVPPEFFEPSSPPVSLAGEEPEPNNELVLQIEVPPGATEEEVLEFVKQLVDKVDALDRAYGGQGLRVKSLEAFDEAALPVEVLS
jgi:hypothetical protein